MMHDWMLIVSLSVWVFRWSGSETILECYHKATWLAARIVLHPTKAFSTTQAHLPEAPLNPLRVLVQPADQEAQLARARNQALNRQLAAAGLQGVPPAQLAAASRALQLPTAAAPASQLHQQLLQQQQRGLQAQARAPGAVSAAASSYLGNLGKGTELLLTFVHCCCLRGLWQDS